MIEDAWGSVEALLHRWVVQSTGLSDTSVHWPGKGLPRKAPPACSLSVLSERNLGKPGSTLELSTQATRWLITATGGEGTHRLSILEPEELDPTDFAEVTLIDPESTATDLRDALKTEAASELADFVLADSGAAGFTIQRDDSFHVRVVGDLTATLQQGPTLHVRRTPVEIVVSLEFRAAAVSGTPQARTYAASARNAMPDYAHVLGRCGFRWGGLVGSRPGYPDDLDESRHILDVALLGHVLDIRGARPWLRRIRTTFEAGDVEVTAIGA